MRALLRYKDAVKQALCAVDSKERLVNVAQVQLLEESFNREMFLVGDVTKDEATLDKALVTMREHCYLLRYGDYLADSLRRFRSNAVSARTEGHEALLGGVLWTDIWNELKAEHDGYPPPVGIHASYEMDSWFSGRVGKAISRACSRLQLNRQVVLKVIETYSDRNDTVHRDLNTVMRIGNWGTLAKTLYNDLNELPNIIPPDREHELELIRAGVEEYRDHYFNIYTHGTPLDPFSWVPSAAALEFRDKLIKQEADNKRKQERHREASLQIENDRKRTASTEVPRGSEKDVDDQAVQRRAGPSSSPS
jgi:hypothetical protein